MLGIIHQTITVAVGLTNHRLSRYTHNPKHCCLSSERPQSCICVVSLSPQRVIRSTARFIVCRKKLSPWHVTVQGDKISSDKLTNQTGDLARCGSPARVHLCGNCQGVRLVATHCGYHRVPPNVCSGHVTHGDGSSSGEWASFLQSLALLSQLGSKHMWKRHSRQYRLRWCLFKSY
jgi:hypothetical protein